jgi:hypothetical protein
MLDQVRRSGVGLRGSMIGLIVAITGFGTAAIVAGAVAKTCS